MPQIPLFTALSQDLTWLNTHLSDQNSIVSKAIAYGYVHRFDDGPSAKGFDELLDFLQQPKGFQWQTAHPVQQKILIQAFYHLVHELKSDIVGLNEENALLWLQKRDNLHSLAVVVAEWEPQRALVMALQNLDTQYPHTEFSAFLPDNQLLSKAYQRDPMCWWGKSAQMRHLYDRLLQNN